MHRSLICVHDCNSRGRVHDAHARCIARTCYCVARCSFITIASPHSTPHSHQGRPAAAASPRVDRACACATTCRHAIERQGRHRMTLTCAPAFRSRLSKERAGTECGTPPTLGLLCQVRCNVPRCWACNATPWPKGHTWQTLNARAAAGGGESYRSDGSTTAGSNGGATWKPWTSDVSSTQIGGSQASSNISDSPRVCALRTLQRRP